jgi:hypothetical protein
MNSRSFLEYKDEPRLEWCFFIRNWDERIEKRLSEKKCFQQISGRGRGVVYGIRKVLVVCTLN